MDSSELVNADGFWLNRPRKKVTGGQGHSFIKLIWDGNNCDTPPRRSDRAHVWAAVLNRLCRLNAKHLRWVEEREPGVRSEGRRGCWFHRLMRHQQAVWTPACYWCSWGSLLLPGVVLNIFPLYFQDSPLILQSDRNVTVNARNDQGQLTGQLTVGKINTDVNAAVGNCFLTWL